MGEDFLECLVMETADRVKSAILGCASFGHQDMDMGVEVDAVAESLDNSHNTRHKLKTCGCAEKLHKCAHRIETERIEEFAFEAEKKTQHLGHGEDDLAGGTSSRSSSCIHSPHSSRRLAWQNPRVLQENINSRSSPQSGHRMWANPHIGLPQFR